MDTNSHPLGSRVGKDLGTTHTPAFAYNNMNAGWKPGAYSAKDTAGEKPGSNGWWVELFILCESFYR